MASIALIGFGEAAIAFVRGWARTEHEAHAVTAYDIITETDARADKLADYTREGVSGAEDLETAIVAADIIFSLVTADQALLAAEQASMHLKQGSLYLDCNSCAPESKRTASKLVTAAGGRYVDVGVMAPVNIDPQKVPLLVSGNAALSATEFLVGMGMRAEVFSKDIGGASTVKMLRSVMVKGMEALALECILSARVAGVDEAVLSSFEASDPEMGWRSRINRMMGRSMQHGARRAAEMREVTKTVEDLGIDASMSKACAMWQDTVGGHGIGIKIARTDNEPGYEIGYEEKADALLQVMNLKTE